MKNNNFDLMKKIKTTLLFHTDILPLTCTRTGTCCHGNQIWINPWEVRQLADTKKITVTEFCDKYTDFGGIRLKFEGNINVTGKKSCLLYDQQFGCSVHTGRPLACRMYPLGRQIQHGETQYIYQGDEFPCFKECPEVKTLPHLSVGEYLKQQETTKHELAQSGYLEVVQNLADNAFALLLDTPLALSDDRITLKAWRELGMENPETLYCKIDKFWMDALMNPPIETNEGSITFVEKHNEFLQQKIQDVFGGLNTIHEIREASIFMMTMALYLAIAIGANVKELSELWIDIAKANGALE